MGIVVQKYGGSSLADVERIKAVAERIKLVYEAGHQVVVVVSARAGVTNSLISQAKAINKNPNEREMDALLVAGEQETIALVAIALEAIEVPAVSRTGAQAGIVTDFAHTRAKIIELRGGDILEQLGQKKVVIVAGFQGISKHGNITTLGRGGSDLTAIALAYFLNAHKCQIYTDVEGVYTMDPRVVPNATKIEAIAYEEMLELASLGAKVMQARAVEFAQKYGVEFEVRSSFNQNKGTIVKAEIPSMEEVLIRGGTLDESQTLITLQDIPHEVNIVADIFKSLGDANILVDMIIQNPSHQKNRIKITFTVKDEDVQRAFAVVRSTLKTQDEEKDSIQLAHKKISIVSVVGVGMRTHSGVAAKLFAVLAENKIQIEAITTSEIRISCAIDPASGKVAIQKIHAAFGLESSQ